MIGDTGTIDYDGFTADLKAINANTYPQLQLLKLPLNLAAGVIFTVPLQGSGNNLVLTYEALDAQGNYCVSSPAAGSINPGAVTPAQGYARFNGLGPWLPLSMFSPLMTGLSSTNPNYAGTPIIGGGFNSIQMPIQKMEWQVEPALAQSGQLLAFFGMNYGLGSSIGNGTGSTYAIPSAAGPIGRLVEAIQCGCK
jgi:hypothetical protein